MLSESERGRRMLQRRALINRLEAEDLADLNEFDRLGEFALDGYVNAAAWCRGMLRMRPAEAAQRVKMARYSASLPETTAAFESGEISAGHVAVITNAAADIGIEEFTEHQCDRILSELAQEVNPHEMNEVVIKLRDFANPDGSLKEANHDFSRRHLSISPLLDGMHDVRGLLDREGAAIVITALEALMQPDQELTAGQRRADALVELARAQLQSGELPTVAGERPQLLLLSTLPTLKREKGAECSELEWGGFIHRETARRIACDCSLTPIIRDENGNVIGSSNKSRNIPLHVRKALYARDRCCRFPGCGRPAGATAIRQVLNVG